MRSCQPILKSLVIFIITILINLFIQFCFLTRNLYRQSKKTERFKLVAATYNKEYLPIDKFINIEEYIERNTSVHLEDLIGLQMIVVRKPNNIKQ